MKTKIIYISGNEVFDMRDIRAAFEEVRTALNLDKKTVLFGVPVDEDDAGLAVNKEQPVQCEVEQTTETEIIEEFPQDIEEEEEEAEQETQETVEEIVQEPVVETQTKKRGRPRKEEVIEQSTETTVEEEKIVPILSVLSTKDEDETKDEEIEIIPEITDEEPEQTIEEIVQEPIDETEDTIEDDEADLEKLLSAMTPLQEDILEKTVEPVEQIEDASEDISVDATLEQLATEFAENQDKIAAENKTSSRSKIGKLRNILPFKQSKHKDQGLGDLFGWAGMAANDEDFSVPGFFTNAASKK